MATGDFIDLRSNEVILKAAEYLRMLPEWKRSPGKLRSGYVEFGETLSRALVALYCRLEGKPDADKFEVFETITPREETAQEHPVGGADFAQLEGKLNAWHLELAIVQDAFERVTVSISEDADMGAIAHVLTRRFHDLVENMPFPET